MPRIAVPMVKTISTKSNTRSAPNRCARRGAKGANTPRQTTGKVVKRPAAVADMPVASMISGRRTETLEKTGRKLAAISTRLRPSSTRKAGLGRRCAAGCGTLSASASTNGSACCASSSSVTGRDATSFVWLMMPTAFQVLQSEAS